MNVVLPEFSHIRETEIEAGRKLKEAIKNRNSATREQFAELSRLLNYFFNSNKYTPCSGGCSAKLAGQMRMLQTIIYHYDVWRNYGGKEAKEGAPESEGNQDGNKVDGAVAEEGGDDERNSSRAGDNPRGPDTTGGQGFAVKEGHKASPRKRGRPSGKRNV